MGHVADLLNKTKADKTPLPERRHPGAHDHRRHAVTAAAIGRELGITGVALTGAEFAAKPDQDLLVVFRFRRS